MTEHEAMVKWCPMVRYERDLVNRSDPHPQNMNCIGSACMMWRKISVPQDYPTFKVTFTGEEIHSQQIDIIDGGGYCGLAGKP